MPELIKVRRAAILALREFAMHPAPAKGGQIEITRDFPLGVGMGSSTSDVTATIRAVADYYGVVLSREQVGRLAVLAEFASDSIMIDDRVVLFAHRDGEVLETLGHRLPPMIVLGCNTEPGSAIDTLGLQQADYSDTEIGIFQVLRAAMRRAVAALRAEDLSAVGALYRPGPMGMQSHTNYALRKNGQQEMTPLHPELEEPLREVLASVQRVAGKALQIREEARREGDPPVLVARADRVRSLLGWIPRLDDLDTIVANSLRWEEKLQRDPW